MDLDTPVLHQLACVPQTVTSLPKNWIISNNIISFSLDPPMLLLSFSQALPKDKYQSRRITKIIPQIK